MANGEDDGSKGLSPDEQMVQRGKQEEEGRAERARLAAEQRLEATKQIAAAEGRVLDTLKATLENRKQQLEFEIEYEKLRDTALAEAKQELAVLEARGRVLQQTA